MLSDLKWRPAVQTWVLWLHIKPFNHRAPCSTKKPLMRSLPRMNKQALMKRARALSLCEGYGKQGESWNGDTVTNLWVWVVVAKLRGCGGFLTNTLQWNTWLEKCKHFVTLVFTFKGARHQFLDHFTDREEYILRIWKYVIRQPFLKSKKITLMRS